MENWFSDGLIKWYLKNKRDLPWRHETDPYKIWLSEIILQQTQVAQGLNYYLKFTQTYPSIKHLAMAKEDAILKLWQGLGYYSRARNLHFTAKLVTKQFNGKFPRSFDQIKALKGIGDYTAAAIASFAYNLPHAVVDGNVYRVLSRVFGIKTAIDSSKAKKEFQTLANELLDAKQAALNNQAIMEFGSQQCKVHNPDCQTCVFSAKCFAFTQHKIKELPYKAKKTKITDRYFNYLVIIDQKGKVLINKRSKTDIWKGLYEFYLVESDKAIEFKELLKQKDLKQLLGKGFSLVQSSMRYKHILSHQHLYTCFYVISLNTVFKSGQQSTSLKTLNKLAFPRLIEKFLNTCDLKEIV